MLSRSLLGLCLLLLAAALYDLGAHWRQPLRQLPTPEKADLPPPAPGLADSAARILASHLFGRPPAGPAESAAGRGAPALAQALAQTRLLGVMAEGEGRGSAVLARGGQASPADRYKVGDKVPGIGALQAVWPEHVIFNAMGGPQSLYLVDPKRTGRGTGRRAQASAPVRRPTSLLARRSADPEAPD